MRERADKWVEPGARRRQRAAGFVAAALALLGWIVAGKAAAQNLDCPADIQPGDIILSQLGGNLLRVDPNPADGPPRPPAEAISQLYASIAYSPDGRLIGNRGSVVWEIDLQACGETAISPNNPEEDGLFADAPDMIVVGDKLYAIDDSRAIRGVIEVDLETGEQRMVTSSAGIAIPNLLFPRGITANEHGDLFVADRGTGLGGTDGRIVRVDPSTPYDPENPQANQTVIAAGFNASLPATHVYEFEMQDPLAITIDDTGFLLVTDQSRIMRFNQEGDLQSILPIDSGLTFANDIEIYPGGDFIVPGHDFYLSVKAVLRVDDEAQVTNLTLGSAELAQPRRVEIVPESARACADADGSGTVTASDALIVLKAAVGAQACEFCLCDVDDSGSLTTSDALRVLQAGIGINVVLLCPTCS